MTAKRAPPLPGGHNHLYQVAIFQSLEELYYFVGEGWEQEDDITLLTLKRCTSLS